ncbi:MAG: hypothetical protein HLUCCO02_05000 [Idiomarinaceae bacterium HL-53]|nr:MAG: hypothetical protein HLUCCO02_05000 [Idiomarinaceae bacterium HL-53]CUS47916.1 hypothetical protein Ga0003345_0855 [Idiomarinaceae bacterium HL-53]
MPRIASLSVLLFSFACLGTSFSSFEQVRPGPGGGATPVELTGAIEWDKRTGVEMRLAAYSNTLLGDSIDPHLGSLSFQHTDISLLGNSDLPVELTRQLSAGYFYAFGENTEFGDWNYVVPRLSV